ncbi:HU family DNA-binding protein [Spirillospora sp. CA-255316]
MNKSELIEAVAERAGSDRAVARRHVEAVFDAIIDSVTAGERVLVTGFGTFDRAARPARTARNPRTGQAVEVAAGDVPRFRFGQTFRNRVAQGGDGASGGTATAAATAAPAQEETAAAEVQTAKPPKKDKKAKKGKQAAAGGEKARARKESKNAKKPAGKGGKKGGSGKKAAKAR